MRPFRKRRAKHLTLGRRGESIAASLLRELGLQVLVRNYTTPAGEIDIVARDRDMLCFVEVKTRHRAIHSRPADAVGRDKKRRIARTAHRYLKEIGRPPLAYRFDIVEVLLENRWLRDLRYWPNAFTESPRRI